MLRRILPRLPIGATQKFIGRGVVETLLSIPLNAAAETPTDHPKQGRRRRAVSDLDIAYSPALAPDCIDKIGPKLLDVLAVGIVELRLHVDDLGAFLSRIE